MKPGHSYFLFSIFLLFFSCGVSPYVRLKEEPAKPDCFNGFKPRFTSELYTAYANVKGKHLSGLLVFKKMPDSTIRVVFSSEMGIKFFDFEFAGNNFKVHYCMKQLNRKPVVNQLREDLELVLMNRVDPAQVKSMRSETEIYFKFLSGKEETYYITDPNCTRLARIENASKKKKKAIVNLSGGKPGAMADSIYIAHQLFDFNISLKKLIR